jgi:nucleoside-diphosphate-sugar epimerase
VVLSAPPHEAHAAERPVAALVWALSALAAVHTCASGGRFGAVETVALMLAVTLPVYGRRRHPKTASRRLTSTPYREPPA